MTYDIFDSPVGKITVGTDGKQITAIHIEGDRYFKTIPSGWQQDSKNKLLQRAKKELDEYFAGKRQVFDMPFSAEGTPFQKQVWKALVEIPCGTTTSYGKIAAKIGNPKAVRAVGSAVGRNPVCIIVPCHRVLSGDGSIGGYAAGVARKEKHLKLEKI